MDKQEGASAKKLTKDELRFIQESARFLENPSIIVKIANLAGKPIDMIQDHLPQKVKGYLSTAVNKAMHYGLKVAISSLGEKDRGDKSQSEASPRSEAPTSLTRRSLRSEMQHNAAVAVSGGIGGFFGPVALAVELPISTAIMLRSIAASAREFGMDLNSSRTQLECLYVFALGAKASSDDSIDSAYISSRIVFERSIQDAATYIAKHSLAQILASLRGAKGSTPVLVRLLARIGTMFEAAVGEKLLAASVPVIGAVGGAAINAAFANYFNQAARHHFGLRSLEAKYGEEFIRGLYLKEASAAHAKA